MHGNAATVAILFVLAAYGEARLSGEAGVVRRSKPAAAAAVAPVAPVAVVAPVPAAQTAAAIPAAPAAPQTAPATPVAPAATAVAPVASLAAPVAAVAEVAAKSEQDVVRQALDVAGSTYEALHAQAADGRVQGPGSGTRAEQAKQIVAQLRPVNQQPVEAATPAQPIELHSGPTWPSMPRFGKTELDAELLDAEAQMTNKLKELSVQTRLEKEKEEAAAEAQKHAVALRERATNLRKDADAAAQIAKDKSESAAKAEKGLKQTQNKAEKILEEERVMQRFLNQTKKEELVLERNVSNLKLEESQAAQAAIAQANTTPKNLRVHSAAAVPKVPMNKKEEAMKKLVEENLKLKEEKAALEMQLSDRKVAKEKAKLKQKLKNRLALADRHMKLQKRMLRVQH